LAGLVGRKTFLRFRGCKGRWVSWDGRIVGRGWDGGDLRVWIVRWGGLRFSLVVGFSREIC
jgi:hypothetical protein